MQSEVLESHVSLVPMYLRHNINSYHGVIGQGTRQRLPVLLNVLHLVVVHSTCGIEAIFFLHNGQEV